MKNVKEKSQNCQNLTLKENVYIKINKNYFTLQKNEQIYQDK